jgi:hypothetical protein
LATEGGITPYINNQLLWPLLAQARQRQQRIDIGLTYLFADRGGVGRLRSAQHSARRSYLLCSQHRRQQQLLRQ